MTAYVKRAPIGDGKGRSRMWQTMRMLPRFTVADLMATADASKSAAKRYVRELRRADYVRLVQPVQSGVTGGHAIYALARNTGPYAPRIGTDRVRDPNVEPTAREPSVTIPRSEYERALRCVTLCEWLRAHADSRSMQIRALQALEVVR